MSGTVTVTVVDDDVQPPALVFSPQQLSVDEGDTATYRLSLATQPTGAVTVAVSSSDRAALSVPVSFVFTTSNWDQPRTVTVRGVEDNDTDNETVTVTHRASGWWLRVGDRDGDGDRRRRRCAAARFGVLAAAVECGRGRHRERTG